MNTRNWRNKSIDTTPENDHYSYPVGKRNGSTANGERHQTIVVASNNPGKLMSQVTTTDYSYNIGPTSQYKQS
jgi:hypothetical protein